MIQLIVTRKCNFLCSHCMWSCDGQGEHMTPEVFNRALMYVEKAAAVDIIGGEPTLHPDFGNIVDRCSKLVSSMRIATNGSWARPRLHKDLELNVFKAICRAAGKIGEKNLFIRLSDDRWHRKFTRAQTINRAYVQLSWVSNVYTPAKYGVMYPLGRAKEGKPLAFIRSRKYDRAPAECTKGHYSFWKNASIDINGDVSPCTHHQSTCGNILRDSLDCIVSSAEQMISARQAIKPTNMECSLCSSLS